MQQSCLTGEMPRRDTCSYRQDLDMAIKQRLLSKYGGKQDKTQPIPGSQTKNYWVLRDSLVQFTSLFSLHHIQSFEK